MRFSLVVLLLAGTSVMAAAVVPNARQYDVIPNRNVFGLRGSGECPGS